MFNKLLAIKYFIIFMIVFVILWMGFCAMADFVIMFESRAYTMTWGALALAVCTVIAGLIADKFVG